MRASAQKNERWVEIRVIDSVRGIPSEILEKMFLPLFTTKSGESGTGLGLSIFKRFMEEQGGSVEVETGLKKYVLFIKIS